MSTALQDKQQREDILFSRLKFLYGKKTAQIYIKKLEDLLSSYGFDFDVEDGYRLGWDESDVILITYGDVIKDKSVPDTPNLKFLKTFLDTQLDDVISTVHILPFFPSSSDAGYSVIDYKKVRNDLGTWDDIENISQGYKLMMDLVINHTSRYNQWFLNYLQGKSPGKDYFIEVKKEADLSAVTRPRNSPLLTEVETNRGSRLVWTTFSDDQIDLNFSNPDVLLQFMDIFLYFYSKGARVIRFDAIAYLWKKIGTSSIHLEQTHQVVKFFRNIAACIDPEITIITETNVPFKSNISYFGDQDEAQMIYQFSLPPLLLHAILTGNAAYLTQWAADLPELDEGCTFLNFTASHDGIGMQPLLGLIPEQEFNQLVEGTKERGGFVSYKANSDGSETPYELNITYYDAFQSRQKDESDEQMKRFLCSQIIMLSLQGVPAVYFHSLTATKNNLEGVSKSGKKRDINRMQWNRQDLQARIDDESTTACGMLCDYRELLAKRKSHSAFHPKASQEIFNIDDRIFSFLRDARIQKSDTQKAENAEAIFVMSNVSGEPISVSAEEIPEEIREDGFFDILGEQKLFEKENDLQLNAYQTVWLKLR